MRAEVIDIRSVSRVALREEAKDLGLAAFEKALKAEKLSTCAGLLKS